MIKAEIGEILAAIVSALRKNGQNVSADSVDALTVAEIQDAKTAGDRGRVMEFKIVITTTENVIVAAKDTDEAEAIAKAMYERSRRRLTLQDNLRVEVVPIAKQF